MNRRFTNRKCRLANTCGGSKTSWTPRISATTYKVHTKNEHCPRMNNLAYVQWVGIHAHCKVCQANNIKNNYCKCVCYTCLSHLLKHTSECHKYLRGQSLIYISNLQRSVKAIIKMANNIERGFKNTSNGTLITRRWRRWRGHRCRESWSRTSVCGLISMWANNGCISKLYHGK